MSKAGKSEVYRWRLSPVLRAELEAAARDEKASIDAILARLVREWLAGRASGKREREAGEAVRRWALLACAGVYRGDGTSATNERVRRVVGEYLEAKYRRQSFR